MFFSCKGEFSSIFFSDASFGVLRVEYFIGVFGSFYFSFLVSDLKVKFCDSKFGRLQRTRIRLEKYYTVK